MADLAAAQSYSRFMLAFSFPIPKSRNVSLASSEQQLPIRDKNQSTKITMIAGIMNAQYPKPVLDSLDFTPLQ